MPLPYNARPTPEQRNAEVIRCLAPGGFLYFLEHYVQIEDQARGSIPFALWPCHRKAAQALEQHHLIVVLKARQIGMSWLFGAAYPLWLTHFRPNKLAMLFSMREDEAAELIRKCRFIWQRIPPWMQIPIEKDNAMELAFRGLESRIVAFPSSPSAGSSYSASYALADEHAKQTYAREQYAAVRPTIDMGGQFVSVSTANGPGTFHHRLWQGAVTQTNGFHPLFFGYDEHPMRDAQWWEDQFQTYDEPWRFHQEYPRCIAGEARVGTDRGLLRLDDEASWQGGMWTNQGVVSGYYVKGNAPLLQVSTKRGYTVCCTPEHPFATPGGWVASDALRPGDIVCLDAPLFASQPYTVRWRPFPSADASLEITPDWGELLGYFVGDGSLYNHTLSLVATAKDADVVERLRDLCRTLLGVEMGRRTTGNQQGCTELRIRRAVFEEIFDRLGVFDSQAGSCGRRRVCVPEAIWRSPKPVVARFLRGLFEADGSANKSSGQTVLSAKSRMFLQDVQVLLLGFGITSSLHSNPAVQTIAGKTRTFDGYTLQLRSAETDRFLGEIGFISARKNALRAHKKAVGRAAIPITFTDEIASVLPAGVGPVYDLTIEGQHAFDANGFRVHNSPDESIQASTPRFFNHETLQLLASRTEPLDLAQATPAPTPDLAALARLRPRRDALGCRLYQLPQRGVTYVIGADVAEGQTGGDAQAALVLRRDTGEEVALLHGRWPIAEYAAALDHLASAYGALLAIERNNHGTALILAVQRLMAKRRPCPYTLYYERPTLDAQGKVARPGKPGWLTTPRTRPMLYTDLADAVRDGDIKLATQAILEECKTITEDRDGKISTLPGFHDDLVIATAIAYQMVLRVRPTPERPQIPFASGRQAQQRAARAQEQAHAPTSARGGRPPTLRDFFAPTTTRPHTNTPRLRASPLQRINEGFA